MSVTTRPSTEEPRPAVSERVRLRADEVETLARVSHADEMGVDLAITEPSTGPAELVFSHPRGVICLEGELSPQGTGVRLTVTGHRRLDQRRNAYRLELRSPVVVFRRDGQQIECRTADLSLTGVRILGADQLIEGESVELTMHIEELLIEVTARVVRQDVDGCAVTFAGLSPAAENRLGTFLAAAQRAALLDDA